MKRRIVIGLIAAAAVAGLLYAAIAMDLIGMILGMHTLPEGAH